MVGITRKVADHVAAKKSNEAKALGYLQRLNLAGMDVKGQLSLAYSQLGLGLSASAKVDLGAMLVPFVHVTGGAGLSAAHSAHALFVLHRLNRQVWFDPLPRPAGPAIDAAKAMFLDNKVLPPPPLKRPDWYTHRPIAMAHLTGKTQDLKFMLEASAWAGLGDNFGSDEAGLTIGAKAEVEGRGRMTRLVDPAVRHFGHSANDQNLANHVDDLLEQNVKSRAAAWLIMIGGGMTEARQLGHPMRSAKELVAEHKSKGELVVSATETVAGWVDDTIIPDVDNTAIFTSLKAVVRSISTVAKKTVKLVKGNSLKTDDLLKDLEETHENFRKWADLLDPEKPTPAGSQDEHPGPAAAKAVLPVARLRENEAAELIGALKRARDRKQGQMSIVAKSPGQTDADPLCYLNMYSVQGWAQASAGAKVVLPTALAKAKALARARVGSKRNSIRYQNFVPGPNEHSSIVVSTQDTVVSYNLMLFEVEATAKARKNIRPKSNAEDNTQVGGSKKKHKESLTTMTYRSATANWFLNGARNRRTIQPNGSGLSFGLSLMAGRFQVYGKACKKIGRPAKGAKPKAFSDKEMHELEQILKKQLRVSTTELRSFMRRVPTWIGGDDLSTKNDDEGKKQGKHHDPESSIEEFDSSLIDLYDSLILESAFTLSEDSSAAIELQLDAQKRPNNLFDLTEYKKVAEHKATKALRLQSIRLRYRIREDEDKSRALIQLGWNPQPWNEDEKGVNPPFVNKSDDDEKKKWWIRVTGIDPKLPDWLKTSALAVQVGLSLDRIERVGSEGMLDLHTHLYPNAYSVTDYGPKLAAALEDRNQSALAETLVPSVMFFSQ